MIAKRHSQVLLICLLALLISFSGTCGLQAEDGPAIRRCEVLPLADHQVSLRIDGAEMTRWHFDAKYPRPFLFPLQGPSGVSLTRIGHPGAPNHDHHLSVWFAHHDVDGLTFWADGKGTQIRQKQWYAYHDGDAESLLAVSLGWFDPEGNERMTQDLVVALIPLADEQYAVELQSEFKPGKGRDSVSIGKSNFGFLAVRVASTMSAHFGSGILTSSEGAVGEPDIFGKPARWMDYSGHVVAGTGDDRRAQREGITYFDHPSNPRYPTHWHVRSDGWMGASFAMQQGIDITEESPLRLRYLLHVHRGVYDSGLAQRVHDQFAQRPAIEIIQNSRSHTQFEARRKEIDP